MAGALATGFANVQAIRSAGNFASGGIVPGNSFTGDNLQANVNSREMILNVPQQKRLFDLANGAGGRSVSIVVKNFGVETTVEEKRDSNGQMMTVMTNRILQTARSDTVQDISDGGPISRQMESVYGLKRGGG